MVLIEIEVLAVENLDVKFAPIISKLKKPSQK